MFPWSRLGAEKHYKNGCKNSLQGLVYYVYYCFLLLLSHLLLLALSFKYTMLCKISSLFIYVVTLEKTSVFLIIVMCVVCFLIFVYVVIFLQRLQNLSHNRCKVDCAY